MALGDSHPLLLSSGELRRKLVGVFQKSEAARATDPQVREPFPEGGRAPSPEAG